MNYLKTELDLDDYGEVVNGSNTYGVIASQLLDGLSVVIGWTDSDFTHLDLLFTLRPQQHGALQRGMRGDTDLFVSVSHFGMFGFKVNSENRLYPGYVSEKLGVGGEVTTEKLAELIEGIRERVR